MVLLDGFDEALLGFSTPPDRGVRVAVYDCALIVGVCVKRDGMTPDDARDYVDFNIADAWQGPGSPLLVDVCSAADARLRGIM